MGGQAEHKGRSRHGPRPTPQAAPCSQPWSRAEHTSKRRHGGGTRETKEKLNHGTRAHTHAGKGLRTLTATLRSIAAASPPAASRDLRGGSEIHTEPQGLRAASAARETGTS